jgi:zinc and cadmium transporter
MNAWFPIVAAFGVSLAALVGSGVILLLGKRGERAEIWLLSYAIGTSAFAVVPGAVLAFFWTGASTGTIGLLLPIAAASFLYIALSDLVPSLHHRRGRWAGTLQIVLILLGVATMVLLRSLHGE